MVDMGKAQTLVWAFFKAGSVVSQCIRKGYLEIMSNDRTKLNKFVFVGKFTLVCAETFQYEDTKIFHQSLCRNSIIGFLCGEIRED